MFLTPSATTNRHLFDVDPRRLSIINAANITSAGVTIHQRRTSIVNYYQRRNSQLRKASFTTSTLTHMFLCFFQTDDDDDDEDDDDDIIKRKRFNSIDEFILCQNY
ncbi:unnamed protein product [Rotaria sp. Silwood2]|nr:unnamed protein product [Rotaria sp. Silwood2]CAF2680768.1 unnamed protein product [Rotaria sp. Silwood2]CAF2952731.1 unnamed protein product [Rotaria sp. Silwood2]CAF3116463.1 unnamed protein product [Rotaria sp. Silwood2]CAF3865317.1 unnamed protein product [Rotaria sp. Silwood2]